MFNGHKITCESGQSVLYLFTQPLDASATLVKGIFEHLHEDVLLDWAYNYLEAFDISFVGSLIKVVSNLTVVRNLECALEFKKESPFEEAKVLQFRRA